MDRLPKTLKMLNIQFSTPASVTNNALISIRDEEFTQLLRLAELRWKVSNAFASIPNVSYATGVKEIEQLATMEMTYQLDGRVIDFYEHNRATAKTLRDIVRTKQRF